MEEKDREAPGGSEAPDTRSTWQRNKEELYDKVPLTLRQLDVIIVLGLLLLFFSPPVRAWRGVTKKWWKVNELSMFIQEGLSYNGGNKPLKSI